MPTFACPQCGGAVTAEPPEPKEDESLLLWFVQYNAANLTIALAALPFVALGFRHWQAWLVAWGLFTWAYLSYQRRAKRFRCAACGISFPRYMVAGGKSETAS